MSKQTLTKMRLVADVTFYAASIDDAFAQWREHFSALLTGDDTECVVGMVGEISIEPVQDNEIEVEE